MTADVDIANRALQLLGTRSNITSLTEDSGEASNINMVYAVTRDWATSLENWNFARRTSVLALSSAVVPPVGTWDVNSPPPPWLYQYTLPAGFLVARYLTNSDHTVKGTNAWDGLLQRFAIVFKSDGLSRVLLTNTPNAILVHTGQVTDPTLWPPYFENFMVAALAWRVSMALTGNMSLQGYLDDLASRMLNIALQINKFESKAFDDTTPEWIQARGIEYPEGRPDKREKAVTSQQPRGAPADGSNRR